MLSWDVMKKIIVILLGALVFVSCGHNSNKPVYDTVKNPDGFPPQAVQVIDQMDKGLISQFDSISNTFGELYSSHPNLLDNPQWTKVINLLGVKFRIRGDSLAALGPSNYSSACGMYTLASFARPEDERALARKTLFETWERAILDSLINPSAESISREMKISNQLNILKYFILGDSIQRQFGRDYLLSQIMNTDSVDAALKPSSPTPLSVIDRCFLSVLGFRKYTSNSQIVTFSDPAIDLIATRITPQAGHWYAAEFYFIPREEVKTDLAIALRVAEKDSTGIEQQQKRVLDFRPLTPSSTWKKGELQAAYRRFYCENPLSNIEIGLYDRVQDRIVFLPLKQSGMLMYRCSAESLIGK
jgi:hypothetical protein